MPNKTSSFFQAMHILLLSKLQINSSDALNTSTIKVVLLTFLEKMGKKSITQMDQNVTYEC